jgi:hypothetical protein
LLPAFSDSHDGDGLSGERAAQECIDAGRNRVFKAVQRRVFLQDALPELLGPGTHVRVDVSYVVMLHDDLLNGISRLCIGY